MRVAVDQNLDAIDDGLELLDRLRTLDDPRADSAVGGHFRHCIDFYDCFLAGLPSGRIDYDARRRAREVEARPEAAAHELGRIRRSLADLRTEDLDHELSIQFGLPAAEPPSTGSTVDRELLFLFSHTIHHYALIALLLRQQGVEVPPDFGFAPSTLEHASRRS